MTAPTPLRSPDKPLGGGRIIVLAVAAVVALLGLMATAAGATLVWAHTTQRDDAGYYTAPTERFTTQTYALTSRVDLGDTPGQRDWTIEHPVGTVRLDASTTGTTPLFVGIGPTAAVNQWLTNVTHERVTGANFGPFRPETTVTAGTATPAMPATQTFWVASDSGVGRVTLTWPSAQGDWTIVVANTNATPGLTADVTLAAKTNVLLPIGLGILAGALVLTMLAGLGVFAALRHRATAADPVAMHARPGSYPVRLNGTLDEPLSRWLWLVKWFLLIPHYVVLALLWLAVTVTTVVAGVAILFTGRYPRSIFDFNVGVFRWSWRVSFYATSAFATDRYPPFTLRRDPTYPADLAIDYPEHLSRWRVLVKWWFMAIPHLLIVSVFTGGWGLGLNGTWRIVTSGGLIGLLALIGAALLAIRGHYPDGIFGTLMGFNRWCYRVLAYVALMTDEYPPFRLDSGGIDPGSALPPPPPPQQAPPVLPAPPRDLVDTSH